MDLGRRFGLEPPWANECIIATVGIATTSVLAIALFSIFPPNPGPAVSYAFVFAVVVALWLYCVALDPAEKGGFPCTPLKATQDRERFCRVCYKSVPGLDHHCMWLNTCIGRRNYWAFFSLALLGTAQHLLGAALAVATPVAWPPPAEPVAGVAVFSAAVAALSACATVAFGSLLIFHVHLVSVGLGTYDWLVHRADTRLAAERAANDAEAEAQWQRDQQRQQRELQQQQQNQQREQQQQQQDQAAGSVLVDFSQPSPPSEGVAPEAPPAAAPPPVSEPPADAAVVAVATIGAAASSSVEEEGGAALPRPDDALEPATAAAAASPPPDGAAAEAKEARGDAESPRRAELAREGKEEAGGGGDDPEGRGGAGREEGKGGADDDE